MGRRSSLAAIRVRRKPFRKIRISRPLYFQMSLWTEIINTALIGCERKSLSLDGAADRLGGLLAQLDQNDREGALLGAAAVVSLYERAGSFPLKDAQPLLEACEPDDAPRCSERAAIHLAVMLRGERQWLLPEWLEKGAGRGGGAAEEVLPPVLGVGRGAGGFVGGLLPVLGAPGRGGRGRERGRALA